LWSLAVFLAFQANRGIVPGTDSGHLRGLEYRNRVIGNVLVTVNEIQGFHYMTLHNPTVNPEVIQAGPL